MIINHHPAFSWYSLLFFAALVIGFVLWARQNVAAESAGLRHKSAGVSEQEYRWSVTFVKDASYERECYNISEIWRFRDDCCQCFPNMFDTQVDAIARVVGSISSVRDFFLARTPKRVTVAPDCPSEVEGWVVRGDVFSVEYVPSPGGGEESRLCYSEIDDSGVLNQPRRHAFLAYWASEVCPHEETYYQCVILVPKAEEASDKSPIVLVVKLPR
ncbi:MAG: hypothetical protein KBB51_02400 [Candidatus Moranbacteria bacterium]|nr:hypothetical protein [Candidatus Moranbacteria bacterium]